MKRENVGISRLSEICPDTVDDSVSNLVSDYVLRQTRENELAGPVNGLCRRFSLVPFDQRPKFADRDREQTGLI